jgi:hypothetical protein
VQTGAADFIAFYEGGGQPELPGPDGGGVAACPAADDYEIELVQLPAFV